MTFVYFFIAQILVTKISKPFVIFCSKKGKQINNYPEKNIFSADSNIHSYHPGLKCQKNNHKTHPHYRNLEVRKYRKISKKSGLSENADEYTKKMHEYCFFLIQEEQHHIGILVRHQKKGHISVFLRVWERNLLIYSCASSMSYRSLNQLIIKSNSEALRLPCEGK